MVKENVKRNKFSDEMCPGKTKLYNSNHFLFHILMKFQSTVSFTYSFKKYSLNTTMNQTLVGCRFIMVNLTEKYTK